MNNAMYVLLGLAIAGVVYALVRGVLTMAGGKDVTGRTSNRYMVNRVALQGGAVLIIVVIWLIGRS